MWILYLFLDIYIKISSLIVLTMLTTDECEKIIDNCVAFDLLPAKRQSASERNKVSKFKKLLKTTNNDSIRILSELVIKLIQGQRSNSEDLDIKNLEQYRAIVTDISYCDMSTEDICVNLYETSKHYIDQRKKAQEDLYNQRVEYERIIKVKEQMISEFNSKMNQLTSRYTEVCLHRDQLRDKFLEMDSDDSDYEEEPKVDYNKMNESNNLQQVINSLQDQLEEKDYQINMLKGQLETNDIKCESEEEDNADKEAEAFFAQKAAENEQKRLARRKKFGMD